MPLVFRAFLVLLVPANLAFGHASGNGHTHSTSLGDSSGSSSYGGFSSSGMAQMPQSLMGGTAPTLPPPPPPPPPKLSTPSSIKGNGKGVASKVDALGEPGSALPRPVRAITGIYEDGTVSEEPSRPLLVPSVDFVDFD